MVMNEKICCVCEKEIKVGEDCDASSGGSLDRNGDFEANLEDPWYNLTCSDCAFDGLRNK